MLTTILLPFKFESIHCQVCVPWKVVIFTQGMTVEQSYVQLNSNAIQPDIMGRRRKKARPTKLRLPSTSDCYWQRSDPYRLLKQPLSLCEAVHLLDKRRFAFSSNCPLCKLNNGLSWLFSMLLKSGCIANCFLVIVKLLLWLVTVPSCFL